MTMLYPNLCYNEVCYKGTGLYIEQPSPFNIICEKNFSHKSSVWRLILEQGRKRIKDQFCSQ